MYPKSHAYSRAGPDLALRCSDSQSKALATLDHGVSSVLLSVNYSTESEISHIKNSSSHSKEKVEYPLSTHKFIQDEKMLTHSLIFLGT